MAWRLPHQDLADLRLAAGLLLPACAALAVFGWRAAGVYALVVAGGWVAHALLPDLGDRSRVGVFTLAALLTAFLPATWFDLDRATFSADARWPLALGAGATLGFIDWCSRLIGTRRASPVVVATLLLGGVVPLAMSPDRILPVDQLFKGDLLSDRVLTRPISTAEPWLEAAKDAEAKAYAVPRASHGLDDYLRGRVTPGRPAVTIARLVGDDLPPLEDLAVGGQPAPIGSASGIAVVVGGLLLVHRRMMPLLLPLWIIGLYLAALSLLPIPVVVSPDGVERRWLAMLDPRVGVPGGVTLVNYLLLASPLLFVSFFLAANPACRPTSRWGTAVFAVLFAVGAATLVSRGLVDYGPLIALAVVQLLTPTLDRADCPPTPISAAASPPPS